MIRPGRIVTTSPAFTRPEVDRAELAHDERGQEHRQRAVRPI
jgi:hypothetical protein